MPRFNHPDAAPGEILLGGMFAADVASVGWASARAVRPAYDMTGQRITTPGWVNVLVAEAEVLAAGVPIPDTGPIDHRWNHMVVPRFARGHPAYDSIDRHLAPAAVAAAGAARPRVPKRARR